jgi:hypothetical protein
MKTDRALAQLVDRQSHSVRRQYQVSARSALVSRSLVQQDKSNARLTTTMFIKTAFLAPSVIERTCSSMRRLLVCPLHPALKRPVNLLATSDFLTLIIRFCGRYWE